MANQQQSLLLSLRQPIFYKDEENYIFIATL
jgi:hypothetical protein